MFALGHIALGYLTGKTFGKAFRQDIILPLAWLLSVLPDMDLMIPWLEHRGPTHSVVVAAALFLPVLLVYRWKGVPYLAVLASHPLIGDYITDGGVRLLWPLSSAWIQNTITVTMGGRLETYVELALFSGFVATLILSRDLNRLLDNDPRNLLFFIPLCTILLPIIFEYPIEVPRALVAPHLLLMGFAALSFCVSMTHRINGRGGWNKIGYSDG